MIKSSFIQLALILNFILFINWSEKNIENITPIQFEGSDTQRIQEAVDKAAATAGKVVIPANNSNRSGVWLLDSAVRLPSNITVILDNCTIQLSDSCRDNMFRSNNVGLGIKNPKWNYNISIIGLGEVLLKGANNPRSTGGESKTLSKNSEIDKVNIKKSGGSWQFDITYGSDAGKKGRKQTGDWRNIMVLMAYVNGFKLKNVNIEKSHAWAVSNERVLNAEISDIRLNNPGGWQIINGEKQYFENRDGINLRHGCKNFRIDNVSGVTGDDFIALSTLGLNSKNQEGGGLNSTMITSPKWRGLEDNTERIFISNINCKSPQWGIAIRSNDMASINNVYINGVFYQSAGSQTLSIDGSQFFQYDTRSPKGRNNGSMLVGGQGYGLDSQPGKINNIHAMNMFGDGGYLINIASPIANCTFTNGVYTGKGDKIILYHIDKCKTTNIVSQNLIKIQ
jgi:hypothetical protein